MTDWPDITAGLLVGGHGRRMGGIDKFALERPDGRTFLQHCLSELQGRVARVVLLGRPGQVVPAGVSVEMLADRYDDAGPMAGLERLMATSDTPWVWLVASDMPALAGESAGLWVAQRAPDVEVVVPAITTGSGDRRLQPTCALYTTALHTRVTTSLQRGQLALHRFVASTAHVVVEIPAGEERSFANINTWEDLDGSS